MRALFGAGALLLAAAPAHATELPAGTTLAVRLVARVASHGSHAGDPVEAVLISPIRVLDRSVVSPGCRLRGHVVAAHGSFVRHAALKLQFDELILLDGHAVAIDAQVVEVDNAREKVTADGTIVGLPPFSSTPSWGHIALLLVAHEHPLLLALVEAGRFAKEKGQHVAIAYGPGVDLELALRRAATLPDPALPPLDSPLPSPLPPGLERVVEGLPLRTVAPKAGRPSDLTNLLLQGSRGDIEAAFIAAGWSRALDLRAGTATRGLLALAEKRAYRPAPVSPLELQGRPPDLVFEKQCNTLAKRHHVRLWGGFGEPGGPALWVGAASHDIGIVFSHSERAFTHRIDPRIDRERSKIVDDLLFTGRVEATGLLERPDAPRSFTTAAGGRVETDGRMAVLVLAPRPADRPTLASAATVAFTDR